MYSYGSARSGKSMIRFFFKNHPKFSNQFVSQNGKLGVTSGRTDTFQNDNEFSSLSLQIFREIDDVWRFFREIEHGTCVFQKLSMLAAVVNGVGKFNRVVFRRLKNRRGFLEQDWVRMVSVFPRSVLQ